MPIEVTKRWIQIRVDDKDDRATLYASASDGSKSATGSWPLQLPRQLVRDLEAVIDEHAEKAETEAMKALYQSLDVDRGAAPPDGVKAIKLDGGIGLRGEASGRKN